MDLAEKVARRRGGRARGSSPRRPRSPRSRPSRPCRTGSTDPHRSAARATSVLTAVGPSGSAIGRARRRTGGPGRHAQQRRTERNEMTQMDVQPAATVRDPRDGATAIPVIEMHDISITFGSGPGARRGQPPALPRRGARPDGRERRRQVDADQGADRRLHASTRAPSLVDGERARVPLPGRLAGGRHQHGLPRGQPGPEPHRRREHAARAASPAASAASTSGR